MLDQGLSCDLAINPITHSSGHSNLQGTARNTNPNLIPNPNTAAVNTTARTSTEGF
jgi:hypothetical protein